eukprot:COSAG03_NODE_1444_length_4073_cov_79.022396_4_plen_52_part_00
MQNAKLTAHHLSDRPHAAAAGNDRFVGIRIIMLHFTVATPQPETQRYLDTA